MRKLIWSALLLVPLTVAGGVVYAKAVGEGDKPQLASNPPAAEESHGNLRRLTEGLLAEQKEQEDKDSKKKSNLIQVHVSGIT